MASGWAQGKTDPTRVLSSLGATGPEVVFEAGGHGKASARAMYHPELIRHPDSCPALVLNADYTPLSYYPLSLWPWQTAIKAIFLDRVLALSHYDRVVRSPSSVLRLPSVVALKEYIPQNRRPPFTAEPSRPAWRPCRRTRPGSWRSASSLPRELVRRCQRSCGACERRRSRSPAPG